MTSKQDKKYWRRWNAVSRANDWKMVGGRLVATGFVNCIRTPTSEHHERVWTIATDLAARECRALVPDHLRHGCHIYAIGRDRSHKDFSNTQFSRLLVLWGDEREPRAGGMRGLLIDPEDLASLMAWENNEIAQRRSLVEAVRRLAPFAMIDEIARRNCRQVYKAPFYEDLPLANLRALMGILLEIKERNADLSHAPPKNQKPL